MRTFAHGTSVRQRGATPLLVAMLALAASASAGERVERERWPFRRVPPIPRPVVRYPPECKVVQLPASKRVGPHPLAATDAKACDISFDFESLTSQRQQDKDPFDPARPFWDSDPGWGGCAPLQIDICDLDDNNVLCLESALRELDDPATPLCDERKYFIGIEALPNLDVSHKDSQVVTAWLSVDQAVGVDDLQARLCVYPQDQSAPWFCGDYVALDQQYPAWASLSLDLAAMPTDWQLRLLKVGVEVWANRDYDGSIYLDNVCIGGAELPHDTQNTQFVATCGRRLILEDGTPFYFAGSNSYYPFYMTHYMTNDLLTALADSGIKVLRAWAGCEGRGRFVEDGTPDVADGNNGCSLQPDPGEYDERTFQNLDYLIMRAGELGIRLILTMVNYWSDADRLDALPSAGGRGFNSFGGIAQYVDWVQGGFTDDDYDYSPGWPGYPYKLRPAVKHQFFVDEDAKNLFKAYVTRLLTRVNSLTGVAYKDDPTIAVIELMNEPEVEDDVTDGDVLYDWSAEMSAFIKDLEAADADGSCVHLVAIGDCGFLADGVNPTPGLADWAYNGSKGVDWTRNLLIESVDLATVHVYPDHWIGDPSTADALAWGGGWIERHIELANAARKPVIFEEFGRKCYKDDRDTVFAAWTDLFYDYHGGAAGDCVWMIGGRTNGPEEDAPDDECCESPSGFYPNYDCFTFWDAAVSASTFALIADHAAAMSNKSPADVDASGHLSAVDAILIFRVVMGLDPYPPGVTPGSPPDDVVANVWSRGDFCDNGEVNALDAMAAFRFVMGLPLVPVCECSSCAAPTKATAPRAGEFTGPFVVDTRHAANAGIVVPIGLTTSVDLCTLGFSVGYDTAVLDVVEVRSTGRTRVGLAAGGVSDAEGVVRMAIGALDGDVAIPAGEGPIAEIVFRAEPNAAAPTPLTIRNLNNVYSGTFDEAELDVCCVTLVAPEADATLAARRRPTFAWGGPSLADIRIQLSRNRRFARREPLSFRASAGASKLQPTRRQWRRAVRLLGKRGRGYWRVVGSGEDGEPIASRSRRLFLID